MFDQKVAIQRKTGLPQAGLRPMLVFEFRKVNALGMKSFFSKRVRQSRLVLFELVADNQLG